MTRRTPVLLLLLPLVLLSEASAARFDGTTVILPVIGRFPGAGGTQWRTDLFLSNHSTVPKTVVARFHVTGGSVLERSFMLQPFNDLVLPDVVLEEFGLAEAGGMLVLTVAGDSEFNARARIFNAGNPAGEFGQSVPGIGLNQLRRQAFMYGLSGVDGNRLNAGVANPSAETITVNYSLKSGTNQGLASGTITLGPFQLVQVNDVFASWGVTPRANVSIEFHTFDEPIYGYASEVRNDTGDAIFVFGQSPNQ